MDTNVLVDVGLFHLSEEGAQNAVGQSLFAAGFLPLLPGFAVVVDVAPGALADVAEVVAAGAYHVVPPLVLLNEHQTVRTPLPVLEVLLKVVLAGPLMFGQQTLLAEPDPALAALKFMVLDVDDALAPLRRTQLQVGIVHSLLPQLVHLVLVLGPVRQSLKYRSLRINPHLALVPGTSDVLHQVDLVDAVPTQTFLATSVGTVVDGKHLLCVKILSADGAEDSADGALAEEVGHRRFVGF